LNSLRYDWETDVGEDEILHKFDVYSHSSPDADETNV